MLGADVSQPLGGFIQTVRLFHKITRNTKAGSHSLAFDPFNVPLALRLSHARFPDVSYLMAGFAPAKLSHLLQRVCLTSLHS